MGRMPGASGGPSARRLYDGNGFFFIIFMIFIFFSMRTSPPFPSFPFKAISLLPLGWTREPGCEQEIRARWEAQMLMLAGWTAGSPNLATTRKQGPQRSLLFKHPPCTHAPQHKRRLRDSNPGISFRFFSPLKIPQTQLSRENPQPAFGYHLRPPKRLTLALSTKLHEGKVL